MQFGFWHQQGLEIQVVQISVWNDEDFGVLGKQCTRRRNQCVIKVAAVAVRRFKHVLWPSEGLSIALHGGIEFSAWRKKIQVRFLRRDRPQVGLLFAEPVKEDDPAGVSCKVASTRRSLRQVGSSRFPRRNLQTLCQGSGAAVIGPAEGVV